MSGSSIFPYIAFDIVSKMVNVKITIRNFTKNKEVIRLGLIKTVKDEKNNNACNVLIINPTIGTTSAITALKNRIKTVSTAIIKYATDNDFSEMRYSFNLSFFGSGIVTKTTAMTIQTTIKTVLIIVPAKLYIYMTLVRQQSY